jgi:hypothetical protein
VGHGPGRTEVEAIGLLVAARNRAPDDEAALDAAAALVPRAERVLAGHGYRLALDLGDAGLFVAPGADPAAALELALSLHHELPTHAAVDCAIAVHRGPLVLAGDEPEAGALLEVDRWDAPTDQPGVVATRAALVDPAAGERWRRMS